MPSCFCLAVWGFDRDFLGTGQASLIVLTDAFSCAPPQAAFGSVAWPSISKQLPRSPRSSPSTSLSIGQFDRSKASGAPRSQKKRKGFSFCVCVFLNVLMQHCMHIACTLHAYMHMFARICVHRILLAQHVAIVKVVGTIESLFHSTLGC